MTTKNKSQKAGFAFIYITSVQYRRVFMKRKSMLKGMALFLALAYLNGIHTL